MASPSSDLPDKFEATVIDASVVVAWLVPSQANWRTNEARERWETGVGRAPYTFAIELRSALLKQERKEALSAELAGERLRLLDLLDIVVEEPDDEFGLDHVLRLARELGCSLHDAFYVELARSLDASLLSRDGGQITAGLRLGLDVIDLRA